MAKKNKKRKEDLNHITRPYAYKLSQSLSKTSRSMRKLHKHIQKDIRRLEEQGDPDDLIGSLRNLLGNIRVDTLVMERKALEWELYSLGVEPEEES